MLPGRRSKMQRDLRTKPMNCPSLKHVPTKYIPPKILLNDEPNRYLLAPKKVSLIFHSTDEQCRSVGP